MANHTSAAYEPNAHVPGNTGALADARPRGNPDVATARHHPSSLPPGADDLPGLIFDDNATSSESGGSIGSADGHAVNHAAFARLPDESSTPPPAPADNTATHASRREAAGVRSAHSVWTGGEIVHAHTGGIYSRPPTAADYAYGAGVDLLTDMATSHASAHAGSPATIYPGDIPQAINIGHRRVEIKPLKPMMAMWLHDDADRRQYERSYGGRR
ncbi:hypothetical protein B0A55_08717 [Friedmanniomyces simplex]|uniref:Uncharacterized protein n=1 Tax=Friedmanniomyces simplex TaxID=329884 RepID=A0A4U0X014_9PEZI|nr:hypothetical protein B0A55_08717 [Friedmanniomyces simplex]